MIAFKLWLACTALIAGVACLILAVRGSFYEDSWMLLVTAEANVTVSALGLAVVARSRGTSD